MNTGGGLDDIAESLSLPGERATKPERVGRVCHGDASSRMPAASIDIRVEHVGRGGVKYRDGGVERGSGGVSSSCLRGQRRGNKVSRCVLRRGNLEDSDTLGVWVDGWEDNLSQHTSGTTAYLSSALTLWDNYCSKVHTFTSRVQPITQYPFRQTLAAFNVYVLPPVSIWYHIRR